MTQPSFANHEVLNQSPPFEEVDLFALDRPLADAVAANGGAILAHRLETTEGRHLAFDPGWLQRNGLPADAASNRWRSFDWPQPTQLLEDGERLRWGNLDLQVIWCPGHTRGLVCLFEPRRRLLFTTDHVMRRAPAPVSVRNTGHDDPLREYLTSVAKLKPLGAHTVLPGHGRPFHHLVHRLEQIAAEIAPISDIRSTADYRQRVTVNLLEEFLESLLPNP